MERKRKRGEEEQLRTLQVAERAVVDGILGPGRRVVMWVKGCKRRCEGCIAPEWQEFGGGVEMSVGEVVEEIMRMGEIEGLTLSGGEPLEQGAGLAAMVRGVRKIKKEINVICYTGYRREELAGKEGAQELLGEVDVLIDGVYKAAEDDGKGLRGSRNQGVHRLSGRLREIDFEGAERRAQVRIKGGEMQLIGIPPRGLWEAVAGALEERG